MTVHKGQGVSGEDSLVYGRGSGWDRFMAYVALSRHRGRVKFYGDTGTFADLDALKRALSRAPLRDNVLDYPLQFALRRGEDPTTMAGNAVGQLRGMVDRGKDVWQQLFHADSYARERDRQAKLTDVQRHHQAASVVARVSDLSRAVNRAYSEFAETHGKAWHDNATAKTDFDARLSPLYAERNAAAAILLPDCEKFEAALALNSLTREQVADWAEAHQRARELDVFLSTPNRYEQGRLASGLADSVHGKREVTRRAIWQPINDAKQADTFRRACREDGEFAKRLSTVRGYLACHQASGRYYHKSTAEHFSQSPSFSALPRVEIMTAEAAKAAKLTAKRYRRSLTAAPVIIHQGAGKPVDVLLQNGRYWVLKEKVDWALVPDSLQAAIIGSEHARLTRQAEQEFLLETCGHCGVASVPDHQQAYGKISSAFAMRAEKQAAVICTDLDR